MPPGSEVPPFVHSPLHMASSMIQSQSGTLDGAPRPKARNQKPGYRQTSLMVEAMYVTSIPVNPNVILSRLTNNHHSIG